MEKSELELLAAGVTEKLRERGNSSNTIARHQRVFSQLILFSNELGNTGYSEELIKHFMEERQKTAKEHGPRYMEQYKIALNKLADEADGREIQLNHRRFPRSRETVIFAWALSEMEHRLEGRLKNAQDVRGRIHELQSFFVYLEDSGVKSLKDIRINHLSEGFSRAGDKPRFHSVMCEFLKLSFKEGWMPLDLSCFVPRVRAHKPVPTVYSAEEIERVLACIDTSSDSGKRKRAVFVIIARLGLRNSDVCELQFSNIDWGKKTISLIQKKTGMPIVLPLLPEIEEAVKDYISVRPKSDLPYTKDFMTEKCKAWFFEHDRRDYESNLAYMNAFMSYVANGKAGEERPNATTQTYVLTHYNEEVAQLVKAEFKEWRETMEQCLFD